MKQVKTVERKIKWYTSFINRLRDAEELDAKTKASTIKRVQALRRELKWVLK